MQNYMESIYLVLVVLLFLLAASDLWVGVSNDAVNFMNSAIGSKAAKFRTIVSARFVLFPRGYDNLPCGNGNGHCAA